MNPSLQETPEHSAPPQSCPEPRVQKSGFFGSAFFVFLLLAGGLAIGIVPRLKARTELIEQTEALSIPYVTVIKAKSSSAPSTFSLPGEVKAFSEASIYARTNGYIKRWTVDIGAEVKTGDLLAEIDTPELDQELANIRAQSVQADAALQLAKSTSARFNTLRKTSVISAQESDEKNSDVETKAAAADAAKANARRLQDLQAFQKVYAPFDGVITERNADVGQLVSTTPSEHPLFQISQAKMLRVFVRVPESRAPSINTETTATVLFPQYPGRKFEAKVARTAGAIDPANRTLLVELSLDNSKGELFAGSHAEVNFSIPTAAPMLTLPSNALLFRAEGPQAAVIGPDEKVQLHSVVLGKDFGREIEIVSGITAKDQIVLNPADSLAEGAVVRIAEAPAPAQTEPSSKPKS